MWRHIDRYFPSSASVTKLISLTISVNDIKVEMSNLLIIPNIINIYLTLCTFSFEIKESSLSDTRCRIQDVVSPHCVDKRMARRCRRFSMPNYFVMTSYRIGMRGEIHQCKLRKQTDFLVFIHSHCVSRIHGHILISKDIVSIFSAIVRSTFLQKSVVGWLYSDTKSDRTVTWHWWMNCNN